MGFIGIDIRFPKESWSREANTIKELAMLSMPYSNRLILGIKDVTQVKTQVGILEVKSRSPKHTHS
jgi:hypothetical protein